MESKVNTSPAAETAVNEPADQNAAAEAENERLNVLRADIEKYMDMADQILLARFKDKYYKEALACVDKLEQALAERGEKDPSLDEKRVKIHRLLNEARAYSVVEKYDFACKSREYAKTSEDLGSAALHFKEAADARKKTEVNVEELSEECRAKYEETAKAEEFSGQCTKKAGTTYQVTRVKTLGGFLIVILLAVAVLSVRHTVTFHRTLGSIELAIGMNDNAVKNFSRAYKRCGSEENLQAYINASRKAGMSAYKHKNYESAGEYLHLPAVNGDEEASWVLAKSEEILMQDAQTGDQVLFGGMQWLVLDRDGSKLLLLKYEGTDGIAFQEDLFEPAEWAESSLRTYLNGEYLDENFSPDEQSMIEVTDVIAEDNPDYGTDAGEDTQDQIYLLSSSEAEKYADQMNACGHLCWLRTPGACEGSIALIGIDKDVMSYGYEASSDSVCTKPVMWVNTEQ